MKRTLSDSVCTGMAACAMLSAIAVSAWARLNPSEGVTCDGYCSLFPPRTCPVTKPIGCCCTFNGVLGCYCSVDGCIAINGGPCPDGVGD